MPYRLVLTRMLDVEPQPVHTSPAAAGGLTQGPLTLPTEPESKSLPDTPVANPPPLEPPYK